LFVTAAGTCLSQRGAVQGKTRQIEAVDRNADYRFTAIGQRKQKPVERATGFLNGKIALRIFQL
jgi:hypothetical protein